MNKLAKGAQKGSANVIPAAKIRPTLLDRLSKTSTPDSKREAVKIASNRLNPTELKTILDNEVQPGLSIRDFGLSDDSVGVYDLPNMKRKSVTDNDVDAVWDAMSSDQKKLILPTNAGAPDRGAGKGEASYKDSDWGGDTERMRKGMLKAMLEQSDEEGNVIDPWTGKKLEFPADLDHIVPLAKGGGHGGRTGRQPNGGYESSNWVWIEPKINRNYKNDRDIHDTVQAMLVHERQGEKGYQDDLDKTVKKYEGSKAKQAALRKDAIAALKGHLSEAEPGTYPQLPDPTLIKTMTKTEASEVFKALRDAELIPKGGFGKQKLSTRVTKDTPEPEYQKAIASLYESISEDQEIAKVKVELTQRVLDIRKNGLTPSIPVLPSNKSVTGILKKEVDTLSPKQQHRILDKFVSAYDDPTTDTTLPQEIREIYQEGLTNPIPRQSLSSSPWSWARGGKNYPDLNQLPPEKRKKLYDYLRKSFGLDT